MKINSFRRIEYYLRHALAHWLARMWIRREMMSMKTCDHCHARRAVHELTMTYVTPCPVRVCDHCLRDIDGRQIAAQTPIHPMPEIRPPTGAIAAPDSD